MSWIKGIFSAISGFFGGVSNWVKLALAFVSAVKAVRESVKNVQESNRREKFDEGVAEKDTKKVEDSFNSPRAGKPSGNDVDVWDE